MPPHANSINLCIEYIKKSYDHFRNGNHPYSTYLFNHLNQLFCEKNIKNPKTIFDESCPNCGLKLKSDSVRRIVDRKYISEYIRKKKRGWKNLVKLLVETPKKTRYISVLCHFCFCIVCLEFKIDKKILKKQKPQKEKVIIDKKTIEIKNIAEPQNKVHKNKNKDLVKKSNILSGFLSFLDNS